MQAVGLQTYIWNNNLRSLALLCGFPVLLLAMVYAAELALIGTGYLPSTGDYGRDMAYAAALMLQAAPLAIGVSLVWFLIAYFANQAIIDFATGAQAVERRDNPEFYNLLENLCISRGLKTPTLRIVDSDALNAFASGLHEGQFSITVTRGLLENLTRDEVEAVLGHELTHVINRDVRTMVIAAIFAGIISLMAQILARAIFFSGGRRRDRDGEDRGGGGLFILIAMAAAALAYVLAILIRMAISRQREFIADAGSVELTKNPDAMISALLKVSGHTHLDAPEMVRGLFLEDDDEGVMGLFATHPPIGKRIEALQRYAGGRIGDTPAGQPMMAPRPEPMVPETDDSPEPPPVIEPMPGDHAGPWGPRPRGPWG